MISFVGGPIINGGTSVPPLQPTMPILSRLFFSAIIDHFVFHFAKVPMSQILKVRQLTTHDEPVAKEEK